MNLKALEQLIARGATEGERNAAKRAWEKSTGKTWTGKAAVGKPFWEALNNIFAGQAYQVQTPTGPEWQRGDADAGAYFGSGGAGYRHRRPKAEHSGTEWRTVFEGNTIDEWEDVMNHLGVQGYALEGFEVRRPIDDPKSYTITMRVRRP